MTLRIVLLLWQTGNISAAIAAAQLQEAAGCLYTSQAAHAQALMDNQALRLQIDGQQGTVALQLQAMSQLEAGKRESEESCASLSGLLLALKQALLVEREAHAATAAAGANTIDEVRTSNPHLERFPSRGLIAFGLLLGHHKLLAGFKNLCLVETLAV